MQLLRVFIRVSGYLNGFAFYFKALTLPKTAFSKGFAKPITHPLFFLEVC